MKTNYENKRFSVKSIIEDPKRFIIPTFQRGLVWSPDRKKKFIKVLREGDPIGVILVYEIKDEEGGKRYKLIDGLQRLSTIKAYAKNPMQFLELNDISDEHVFSIIENDCKAKASEYVKDSAHTIGKAEKIKKIVKTYFIETKMTEVSQNDLLARLQEELKISFNPSTGKEVEKLINEFKKQTDISDLEIYAISYFGDETNLPEVFKNLNTGSVALSPYEILASAWSNSGIIEFNDKDIVEKIKEKYKNLEATSDMEVDFDEETLENGVTLFEYCSAISELIFDKNSDFSVLVGERDKKSISPFAFEILSLICGRNVNQAEKLVIDLGKCTPETYIKLKDAIIDIMSHIKAALEKYLVDAKGNSLSSTNLYQIYHIFMAYFKSKYMFIPKDGRLEQIDGWEKSFGLLKKYLFKHYFYDMITSFWQLNRQTQDLTNAIRSDETLFKYKNNISKEKWNVALQEWMERQDKAIKVPKDNRLFLNIMHRLGLDNDTSMISFFQKDGEKISTDVEHIVPKNLFNTKEKVKLPISHIANLCYLVVKDNRAKHDKTLYEDEATRKTYMLDKSFIEFILYPEKEELEFIHYGDKDFCKSYKDFLDGRTKLLVERFIELVK